MKKTLEGLPWAPAVSLAAGFAAWDLLVRLGALPAFLFPPPASVFGALYDGLAGGSMLPHLFATLWHLAAGFSLGCLAGMGLAFLCYRSPLSDRLLGPWINATLPLPQVALLPFFMLLFGAGDRIAVVVSGLASFYNIFVAARSGMLKTERSLIDAARNLGAGENDVFARVVLPSALPYLLVGMHLGLLQALRLVIVAETILSMKGIGYMLWMNGEWLRVEEYYAYVLLLAAVGVAAVTVFRRGVRRLAPWAEGAALERAGGAA